MADLALTVRSDVDFYTYVDLGFHTGTTLLEYLDDVSALWSCCLSC